MESTFVAYCKAIFHKRRYTILTVPPILVSVSQWVVNQITVLPANLKTASVWSAPWWMWGLSALLCVAVAQWLAWRDEFKKVQESNQEKSALSATVSQLTGTITQLNREIDARSPRPAIGLVFSEVPPRSPEMIDGVMVSNFRESDLLVRNGPGHDAYEVYLDAVDIGKFYIGTTGVVDFIRSNQETRLQYSVWHYDETDGSAIGELKYVHRLRGLLEAVFKSQENEEDIALVPLKLVYRDCFGNKYETTFTLHYHSQIKSLPRIVPKESKQLL